MKRKRFSSTETAGFFCCCWGLFVCLFFVFYFKIKKNKNKRETNKQKQQEETNFKAECRQNYFPGILPMIN